jgi:hypothetical protein
MCRISREARQEEVVEKREGQKKKQQNYYK